MNRGWWQASDGNWYPPELHPDRRERADFVPPHRRRRILDNPFGLPETMQPPEGDGLPGWWQASDGNWYPPEMRPGASSWSPPQASLHASASPGSATTAGSPSWSPPQPTNGATPPHPPEGAAGAEPPHGALGLRVKARRNWSWLGLNLGKYAGRVGVVGLLVSLLLGLGFARISFTTSNASYLNASDPAAIENSRYQSLFGGDPIVTMFTMSPGTTIDSFFTSANSDELAGLEQRLRSLPQVFSVAGPGDALQLADNLAKSPGGNPEASIAGQLLLSAYSRDPSPASRNARFAFMSKLLAEQSQIPVDQQVLTNPAWVHFLTTNPDGSLRPAVEGFIPNPTHLVMITYLRGGLTIDQESQAAAAVQSVIDTAHFSGATLLTTGVPALLNTINSYLRGGMLSLTMIAGAIMVLILLLAFSVRWRLLPFAIVSIGLLWAFGLVGYLGIPLTLGSIAGLPILLGVGMDYAIQMHSRVEEEVVLDRAAHPIQATARNLGPSLLVVTFDAVFAFLALVFAKVPMIRQFGELLVVGIVAVCFFSIIGTLAVLGIREYRSPTKGKDFSQGALSRLVVFLGKLPAASAMPLAVVSMAIFGGGLLVEGHLTMQTDPIQWVNPHSPAIEGIQSLMSGTGSENELGVVVTTDRPFSDTVVNYAANLSDTLQSRFSSALFPGIGLVNFVDQLIAAPGADSIHPTGAQVAQVYKVAPPAIRNLMVADDGRELNVVFRARTPTLSTLRPVVSFLQAASPIGNRSSAFASADVGSVLAKHSPIAPPEGVTEAPGGIAVVGVGLLENLASSRLLLTFLSIAFVGAFLVVRLRSLVRALLSLVPVLIAVGAVSLVADAFSLKLSPMTAVAGPLVVAACTEFTSLMLLRFVEERGRGLDPRAAVDTTASRTGRAFLVSAMTAVAGIGVMAASSMPLLRGFGIIVGMNVAVALFCALVILPPVLVFADDPSRLWVSRGLTISYEEPRVRPAVSDLRPSVAQSPA